MQAFWDQLVEILKSHQILGYGLAFILAGVESTPFIGTVSPGTFMMLTIGVLVSKGVYNIYLIILFATLGSIFGDMLTYYFGRKLYKGLGVDSEKSEFLKGTSVFFEKHGDKSILLGKFVGPIRSVLPFFCGYIKMKYSKFLFFTSVGSLIWASTYLLLGNLFGEFMKQIESVMSGVSIVILLIMIIGFGYYAYKNDLITKEMRELEYFKRYARKVWEYLKFIFRS